MTTPAQRRRQPSGVTRQVTAAQAAAAAGTVALAAEVAILQALAGMIAAVLAGTMLYAAAARWLRSAVWTIISEAERELRAVIAGASAAVRADVLAVMAADLGPMASLLPPLPGAGVPRLTRPCTTRSCRPSRTLTPRSRTSRGNCAGSPRLSAARSRRRSSPGWPRGG